MQREAGGVNWQGGLRVPPAGCTHGRERVHVYVTSREKREARKRELGAGDSGALPAPEGPLVHVSRAQRELEQGGTRRTSKSNLNEVMKRHENRTEPLACMLTRAGEVGHVVGGGST